MGDENAFQFRAPGNQEKFYDLRIAPLVEQIVALCRESRIPMFAHFSVDVDASDGRHVSCGSFCIPNEAHPDVLSKFAVLRDVGKSTLVEVKSAVATKRGLTVTLSLGQPGKDVRRADRN